MALKPFNPVPPGPVSAGKCGQQLLLLMIIVAKNITQDARKRALLLHLAGEEVLGIHLGLEQTKDEIETNYDITLSQSHWPSDVYLYKLLKTLKWKHSKLKNVNDMQSARSNLVRLEIYFETLNYESVSEQAAYKWEDLLSDIGGTLGLYVGISIISVFEFVNFILLLCRQCPKKDSNNVGQWVGKRQPCVREQPVIT
ncbi:degenerin-like protein unc-105 [Saccoglossus kowalevskii]